MRKIVSLLVFLVSTAIILTGVYKLLQPDCLGIINNFYRQDKDTVDVLVIGSSNVFSNISPQILWDEGGVASFILAGSGQPVWNSYYYLKEAYKTQSPKLVIVDMLNLSSDFGGYQDISQTYIHTTGLKFSMNKVEEVMNSAEKSDWGSLLLGWPIIHSRWREGMALGDTDDRFGAIQKGFYPIHYSTLNYASDWRPEFYEGSDMVMSEKNETYLRKIIELAQEHDSDVLLLKTPYIIDARADSIYNQAEKIAAEYGIKALNMNKLDFGFIYSVELGDTQHLNDYGVKRVTEYLSNYLSENYELPDRRGNSDYQSWEEYSELYRDTKWLSPRITDTEVLYQAEQITVDYVHERDGIFVLEYPIKVEKNTYYRINAEISSDDIGRIGVELFSPEGYETQGSFFPIMGENNWIGSAVLNSSSTIVGSDDNIPESSEVRFIVNSPEDLKFTINSLTIEKLFVEE